MRWALSASESLWCRNSKKQEVALLKEKLKPQKQRLQRLGGSVEEEAVPPASTGTTSALPSVDPGRLPLPDARPHPIRGVGGKAHGPLAGLWSPDEGGRPTHPNGGQSGVGSASWHGAYKSGREQGGV
jgi:hypothetical protein